MQKCLAELGVPREKSVFISGIGCSSRFPYYMNTYGFHSIHGRAPAIATGLKVARPDLDVWVITGDGDGLSIGGNHLLHALRRNVNLNILLFNNRIYGLTKGQYSPTSSQETKSPSSPVGSIDYPVNPLSFAMGANATFVARAIDTDAKNLVSVLKKAQAHQGCSIVEILQNCPVFNDNAWKGVSEKKQAKSTQIHLEDGKPLLFEDGSKGVKIGNDFQVEVVDVGTGSGQTPLSEIAIHNEKASIAYHMLLASLEGAPVPLGVFRNISKTPYDELVTKQIEGVRSSKGSGNLKELLESGMTWRVGADGRPV